MIFADLFWQQRYDAAEGLREWVDLLNKSISTQLDGRSIMKEQLVILRRNISENIMSQSAKAFMGISIEKACQILSSTFASWQTTYSRDERAGSPFVSPEESWYPTAKHLEVTISKAQRACIGLCLPCVRTRSDDAWNCTREHSQRERDDESSTGDGDVVIVDA